MMKITINGYDVELKAKRHSLDNRYSEEQTKAFLNGLCLLLDDAAKCLESKAAEMNNETSECYNNVAKYRRDDSWNIYKMLEELGYYESEV